MPSSVKEALQKLADKKNTTMSKIIYSLILSKLEEENINGKNY